MCLGLRGDKGKLGAGAEKIAGKSKSCGKAMVWKTARWYRGNMSEALDNLSQEDRTFAPSSEFVGQANATPALFEEAARDRLAFWEKQAGALNWDQK